MGLDAMRISVQIGRFLGISIRKFYKSVCKHPFLVGLVCFLIFLYRSFPFLFSLLVSASPVLVCTAVLLGTLLSFGEPNIPEIEKEKVEEVTHEISSLKRGAVGDPTVVFEKDEKLFIENFVGQRKHTMEEGIGKDSWEENRVGKVEGDENLGDYMPLIDERFHEIQFEKQVTEELVKKREIYEEKQGIEEVLSNGKAVESNYSVVQNVGNESLQVEDPISRREFIRTENGNHLGSQDLSWKQVKDDDEDEEDEDEEASDSGSDGAESSSPDASMADIIPMLDELHPLLDEEAPRRANMSDDGSDVGSEQFHKSKESSVESEEDIEKAAGEEDGDDDNENDEEEVHGGKDDAIKWTEDDQKNLMDLGTSELERNQRLESLIARRRARKSMKLMAEKNLIDLDGTDLLLNIPHITTTRQNPFDHPFDSYDDVPGSAPSVLLPRHNPFDLPYDSNEEKPDLKGDSFQQEFSPLQHREAIFRRHESFSVGPSVLGFPRQERQDLRWRPYFVPEQFGAEETSYHTFQRQLSEASESKVSSVLDTESMSSAMEEEDKKLNEEDVSQETDMISNVDHASVLVERGSLSCEDVDALDIENEGRDVHHDGAEIALEDVENRREYSSLSPSGGATTVGVNTSEILLRMEPGEDEYSSRSSLSSLSEGDEKLSDVKKGSMRTETSNSQIEESLISTQTSLDSDFHLLSEVADENQHRKPGSEPSGNHAAESVNVIEGSSVSDFHFRSDVEDENRSMEPLLEQAGNHTGDSGISMQASLDSDSHFMSMLVDSDQQKETALEPRGNGIEESGISTQSSLDSDLHFASMVVDDNQHREPVYDSSPQAVDKLISFTSISSDTQGETPEIGLPPQSAEFAGKESEGNSESMEKDDDAACRGMHEHSMEACSLDENESRSKEITEIEHDVIEVGLLEDDRSCDGQNGKNEFMKPESGVEHDAVDSLLSLSNNGSVNEDLVHKEKSFSHAADQLNMLSPNAEITRVEKLDSASSSNQVASEETILHALEEQLPVHVPEDPKLSFSESETVKEHAAGMEGILQLECDQVSSSGVDAEIHVNSHQAMGEKLDSLVSSSENMLYNDLKLSANGERQPTVAAEQVLQAHPDVSSSEIKHVEQHSIRKGENLQSKADQVHSSSSDVVYGAGILQGADVRLFSSVSSDQGVPSEEKSFFQSDKQLSWSDKSTIEPTIVHSEECLEPSISMADSKEEVRIANNVIAPENFDHETSEPTSVLPENREYKSQVDEVDFKDNVLDKIVYEDKGHILECSNYSAASDGPPVAEENSNEDEDVIKEIDEGLLSELDTVGDFSVKEVVGELLNDEQIRSPDYGLLLRDSRMVDVKPEVPAVEFRSVADIGLPFKQLHEVVHVEEVSFPSINRDQSVDESRGPGKTILDSHVVDARPLEENVVENESSDLHQSSFDLQVAEAKSREDLHSAMKQASEKNSKEMSKPSDLKQGPAAINEVGSSSSTNELPVLEVKTIVDIDLAFKQLNEGIDVEEVIVPSTIEQNPIANESGGPEQISSDMQVIEARSLEDLQTAMEQVSEGYCIKEGYYIKELPMPSNPNEEIVSTTLEVNERGLKKDSELSTSEAALVRFVRFRVEATEKGLIQKRESSSEESGDEETNKKTSHEPKHGVDETSGISGLNLLETKSGKP